MTIVGRPGPCSLSKILTFPLVPPLIPSKRGVRTGQAGGERERGKQACNHYLWLSALPLPLLANGDNFFGRCSLATWSPDGRSVGQCKHDLVKL